MSTFERYLTVWVALCIVAGIALGHVLPGAFHAIGAADIAEVNLPVAVLIWLMIIPMLTRIDFAALGRVKEHWRGIGVTLFINWAVKPFSMAVLPWIFVGWLFRPLLPANQIDSYIAGLILLAAAPCTAMVFVWSNLSDGEPHFTLSQVALNDVMSPIHSTSYAWRRARGFRLALKGAITRPRRRCSMATSRAWMRRARRCSMNGKYGCAAMSAFPTRSARTSGKNSISGRIGRRPQR